MTVTSAQVSYANQPGYNDCLPSVFGSKKTTKISSSSRRPIISHSEIKPPVQSSAAAPLSASAPPPSVSPSTSVSDAETECTSVTDGDDIGGADSKQVTPDLISHQLQQVLSIKSTLPDREFKHYKSRLETNLPKLPMDQMTIISKCLESVLVDSDNQQNVKQDIIDFMMHHNGVSIWALPLRKVVESLDF